jgi:hypothetical protein
MTGAREAGVLMTLDEPNHFPALPVRTDGPFVAWLGIFPDDQSVERQFHPVVAQMASSLMTTGYLQHAPEIIALTPTSRSRLRWLADDS